MPARDWRKLYQQYKGQWVALADDEMSVIASGPTLREVLEQATKLGYKRPYVTKLPADLRVFVG